MKTYEETIDYLYNQLPMFQVLGPGAYKPGLDTAHLLDNAWGNPHKNYKTIHVAGTNGKGSVSHSLAAVLQSQGNKVGLFTSPHLVDFRERIRVNGEKISKEFVVSFVDEYLKKNLDCQPSFFELTTIMAFAYFSQQKVDWAIIETGLGGRLDTTNIITPVLSVITNVSLDHVALLGDTLAQIAAEKAGIIKRGVPIVLGESSEEILPVIQAKAEQEGARLVLAEDDADFDIDTDSNIDGEGKFVYRCKFKGEDLNIVSDLQGDCQPKNARTIIAALKLLPEVQATAVVKGMENVQTLTGLMGRWMILKKKNPHIVCDTGHNIGAWIYLAGRLSREAKRFKHLYIVIGFANDKDVDAIFPLLPKDADYILVAPNVKRARSAESLLQLAKANGLRAQTAATVKDGYEKALLESNQDDMIYIGGSNFVVAEILS